jgi:two-component system, cell cycle response regulator DivK
MKDYALIIEDDEDLSTIFSEALSAAGFETEIVRDGGIAQARLNEVMPTVIILDMHLPHVSGADLLKQIRADARLAQARIVVTTADARMGEAVREESDFVLIKPISFTQLRELTARLHKS